MAAIRLGNNAYLHAITPSDQRLSPQLTALREATVQRVTAHRMMSSPEQIQFLSVLIQAIQARRIIEVGVFTGYATLAMALAMPQDGQLIGCDISQNTVDIGRPFWEAAGVADKIDIRIAPAIETLSALMHSTSPDWVGDNASSLSSFSHSASSNWVGHTDLIYIDADKRRYADYYELALSLLRPGGLVVIDNVLMVQGGDVGTLDTAAAQAIRVFNAILRDDDRVLLSVMPLGSGMTLALKNKGSSGRGK